jgi:DNA-binding transcriptional ArsR family regulator
LTPRIETVVSEITALETKPSDIADVLELTDPRAMRALAHPARLAILEHLHASGSGNATECAREVGGTPQAASYHLRALAKWGLIRETASADGRETRWEIAARSIKFASGDDSPEFRSAAKALGRRVLERDERAIEAYLEAEHDEPREWREAATFSSGSVHVTAEELAEIGERLHEVMKEYERSNEADRPEGARRVHVVFRAVPRVEPKRKRRK